MVVLTKYTFNDQGYMKADKIVEAVNLMGGEAFIGTTWMDKGADIMWETILFYHPRLDMQCQALDPIDFDQINDGTITPEAIQVIVNRCLGKREGQIK
jgi:hypothetical protein